MNARIFLVPAVHEIPTAAELAIAARAGEEPHSHALTDRPSLDAGTKGVDPPNHFVAGDAGEVDRERAFYRGSIRVADPAGLDANTHLIEAGIQQWLFDFRELSPLRDLDCFVCRGHGSSE